MEKTIKDFTEVELKAISYDNLVQVEKSQAIVKAIAEELNSRTLSAKKENTMENEKEVVGTPEQVVVGETEGTE